MNTQQETRIPLQLPLRRGERRLRIALVGMPNSGKSTLFKQVASTSVQSGELSGTQSRYAECCVQIGLEEASLVDLPSLQGLQNLKEDELAALKFLLWGKDRPPITSHEGDEPPAPFEAPDVIIQVADAASLQSHLELTLQLCQLGRPVVLALNRMDMAKKKGVYINIQALKKKLGVTAVPVVATMGEGVSKLFSAAARAAHKRLCPIPVRPSPHVREQLREMIKFIQQEPIQNNFQVASPFLLMQLAGGDRYFTEEFSAHLPEYYPQLQRMRSEANRALPRELSEECHADRHHQCALIYEEVIRLGTPLEDNKWLYWLDAFFLHPQLGLLGSMAVFALVLLVVLEFSTWLDSISAGLLIEMLADWQPTDSLGVVGRAVVDGLIGLVGIVIPYMLPLVLLLVMLEQSGIMQRIAFVVDRGFHHIGLHGRVAVPFLLGMGCNVPAISSIHSLSRGREKRVASLLVTFVPCSARSAIILALAGKYLGGMGILALFALTLTVIAVVGKILTRSMPDREPGVIQDIPAYALPHLRATLEQTWQRTRDILTIVTPLLVGGSVVLALLSHVGADGMINTLLIPISSWWLGLPVVLGVPILFGVLRKELSLLMIFQALGTTEIGNLMDWVQITTFLVFMMFYFPCVSTFAVMLKTLGKRDAFFSVGLSITTALVASGGVRLVLEVLDWLL